MPVKIKFRRDTSTNWQNNNPILSQGEPGYEVDTGKLKIGDGNRAWNDLPYIQGSGGSSTFTGLTDTPSSYVGNAGKLVAVNSSENGLEFIDNSGGGGSSVIQIDVSLMDPDDTAVGVQSGKSFGGVETIDFDYSNDGAVWFNCRSSNSWNISNPVTLELSYILPSVSSGKQVLLNIYIDELNNNSSSTTNLVNVDKVITDTNSGKFEINDLLTFNVNNLNSLLIFKITRKASDANDTYSADFRLIKAIIKQ